MKDTFYFQHDYHAREDYKIKKLVRSLGFEGYGIYWVLVEMLYESNGKIIADFDQISFDLHVDMEKVKSVATMFDLFYLNSDSSTLSSKSVDFRLRERRERATKSMKAGKASAESRRSLSDKSTPVQQALEVSSTKPQLNTQSSSTDKIVESTRIGEDRIEKDRKVEDRKVEEINTSPALTTQAAKSSSRFITPTINEVRSYCLERKNKVDAEQWIDYYSARGWKFKGGTPMKDWKAGVRTWERNDSKDVASSGLEELIPIQSYNASKENLNV